MILKLKNKVDFVIEYLLIFLMSVMVLNVLWQVFTRFILEDPSSFTDELARYLLIWLGLIAAGYVTGQKMHLAIDYLIGKMSKDWKRKVTYLINLLVFLFALAILFGGGIYLVQLTLQLNQISAALQIKLGYVYLALPISGLLIMFYSVMNVIELTISSKEI